MGGHHVGGACGVVSYVCIHNIGRAYSVVYDVCHHVGGACGVVYHICIHHVGGAGGVVFEHIVYTCRLDLGSVPKVKLLSKVNSRIRT